MLLFQEKLISTSITCEGHFPQQVLDLWCNAQFVQVQAEIKYMGCKIYTFKHREAEKSLKHSDIQ